MRTNKIGVAGTRRMSLVGLLLLAGAVAAIAAPPQKTPVAPVRQPDALILVFAMPDGQDKIGITYPGEVSHAQARRDVQALQAASGWAIANVKITDAPPPLQGAKGKMTSVECTAPHVVRPETRSLAVEPFVTAFRPYRHLVLTYFTGAPFPFAGLRQYRDAHVQIAMEQHGTAFTYQIFISDPQFGALHLPVLQPEATARSGVPGAGPAGPRLATPWLVALIALLALGTGCIVYVALAKNA